MKKLLSSVLMCALSLLLMTPSAKAENGTVLFHELPCRKSSSGNTSCPKDLTEQYLSSDQEQRTEILFNIDKVLVRKFDSFEYYRNIVFPKDFIAAAVEGLTRENFVKRTQGLIAISIASDKESRNFLTSEILRRAEISATADERGVYHSSLYGEVDKSRDVIFKSVLDSNNAEFIGNLARLLRETPLPMQVRRKFQHIIVSSDSDDVRIKIAQALGPGADAFDGVFNLVLTRVISASSDEERMRWAAELGRFPGRDEVVINTLGKALALTKDPLKSGIIARSLAEIGENGVLRLAEIVDVEAVNEKQTSMAILLSAIGSYGNVPSDKVDFVIRTSLKARLKSDDPLLRSSVYTLLMTYGKASIGPIKQVIQNANEETQNDLQEILDRFEDQ